MIETKFWKPSSKMRFGNITNNVEKISNTKNSEITERNKKILKRLGNVFGVIFAILAVISVLSYFTLIRPGLAVIVHVKALKGDAAGLQTALQNRDLVEMDSVFDNTAKDLKALRVSRDANFGWAAGFGLTKEYYSDSDHFITAGLYLVDAGKETINLITPFADAAGLKVNSDQQIETTTSLLDAFSTWITVMPKIAEDSDPVLAKLAKAGDELVPINTAKYPESIKGASIRSNLDFAKTALTSVNDYAPDIKKALIIIPQLLGVETPEKRYMIIMQNDKELRATGGFWTNYATFKVKGGLLNSDFSSKDMYSIDLILNQIDAVFTFPKVPESYQKYLKVERMFARDANISPDYPTALDQFMYFYKIATRLNPAEIKPVDGVFAIDTQVIRELLDVTGPVTVNGVTYTSDNVVLELEKIASLALKEQAGRKRVLGDLMGRMLVNVFESDKNLWSKLVEKVIDLAVRKHVLVYSYDADAQALLEKYNFSGRIVDPIVGDFSYVVSTNLGGDKTNWFVSKKVDHTVSKQDNKYVDTVKLTYVYNQPSSDYGNFVKRFRDWVRIYTPSGSQISSVAGTEDGSVSADERDKTYFTGYVELGPGETKEMTFTYTLPDNIVKNNVYNLYIEKQPGIDTEVHTVTVNGKTDTYNLTKDLTYTKKL